MLNSTLVFDRHHKDVQYYPIPTRSLTEILKTPQYRTFELDISDSHIGQLMIDVPLHSMIGIGAFKTAHPEWLTLSPIVPSSLGSWSQHPVVVKRPFSRAPSTQATAATATLKIVQYSSADELKHVLKESKVMYWAKSLLDYTYNYIDHHIGISPTPLPFEIPHVCFVDAGVALGYGQRNASSKPGDKSKAGVVSAVFLLEEPILFDDNEEFTKFIHNMDCVLSLDEDEYGYYLAIFLAFTQHLQYVQTEGLVFISDYQGTCHHTLTAICTKTDAQV
jgi:hypothetical protein